MHTINLMVQNWQDQNCEGDWGTYWSMSLSQMSILQVLPTIPEYAQFSNRAIQFLLEFHPMP